MNQLIGIKVLSKSMYKIPFIGIEQKKTYVHGEPFKLTAIIKNHEKSPFPGGILKFGLEWETKLKVDLPVTLPILKPQETYQTTIIQTDVLGRDPTLIHIRGEDIHQNKIMFSDLDKNPLYVTPSDFNRAGWVHIHTIYPKTREELYQLYGIILTGITLAVLVFKDLIIPFITNLIKLV